MKASQPNPECEARFECPKCGSNRMRVQKLPNWTLLHWILNPGLAFNELVLGQHVPALSVECRECRDYREPYPQRHFVPCPHCQTLHPSYYWSGKNSFGYWRGMGCPSCGRAIPVLWNVFSLLILAALSPIWFPYYWFKFRHEPLKRPVNLQQAPPPPAPKLTGWHFLFSGLGWGAVMFIYITALSTIPRLTEGRPVNWELTQHTLVWTGFGGLLMAAVLALTLGGKPRKRPEVVKMSDE
jgi:hypothetical protein